MGVPVRGLGQNPVLRAAFWDAGACQPFWEAKNPPLQQPLGSEAAAGSEALPGKEKRYLVQLKLYFCSDVCGNQGAVIQTGSCKA